MKPHICFFLCVTWPQLNYQSSVALPIRLVCYVFNKTYQSYFIITRSTWSKLCTVYWLPEKFCFSLTDSSTHVLSFGCITAVLDQTSVLGRQSERSPTFNKSRMGFPPRNVCDVCKNAIAMLFPASECVCVGGMGSRGCQHYCWLWGSNYAWKKDFFLVTHSWAGISYNFCGSQKLLSRHGNSCKHASSAYGPLWTILPKEPVHSGSQCFCSSY